MVNDGVPGQLLQQAIQLVHVIQVVPLASSAGSGKPTGLHR